MLHTNYILYIKLPVKKLQKNYKKIDFLNV